MFGYWDFGIIWNLVLGFWNFRVTAMMFKKILVANRGEIAVRVLRACREMGITSVTVYSDADRDALHTRYADEVYHLGPAPATESYLKIEKIIEIAKESHAEAIHPGYGFLAENTEFARACEDNRVVFIGPNSRAIELLGEQARDALPAMIACDARMKAIHPPGSLATTPEEDMADFVGFSTGAFLKRLGSR